MPANGLIFLVVVAIWAAYFVQYWIRRRDHLATARSMDRFSESMRVLARRTPLPASLMETPPARSYAVSPARSMRPQVIVKRADVMTSTSVIASRAEGATSSPHATPSTRPHPLDVAAPPTRGVSRRVRGLVLLAQLAVLLLVTALAVLGHVVWWAPLLAVGAIGCAVVWVREGVRAERSARSARGQKPVRRPISGRAKPATKAAVEVAADVATASAAPAEAEAEAEEVQTVLPEPYGFEGPAATTGSPAASTAATAALVDEDDIPLTWDPRPVPRPTYTMKARADRPLPAPADVTPTPIWVDEDDDIRPVEPQRHTG